MNESRDGDKKIITACIDGSGITESIIDTAAWASNTVGAPLKFLHVLEKATTPSVEDRSGAIGPGSVTHLLDELTELDEKRGKLAMELGKHMLEDAGLRARNAGVDEVSSQQRHGDLLEALKMCEDDTRIFVIGRLGEDHENHSHKLGAHLESLVRAIHTPIMVAVGHFATPESFMIAYDGSRTANTAIARIARSTLLKSMPGHVVMIGPENDLNQHNLKKATATLSSSGHDVHSHLRQGNVVDELAAFREEHDIGLMVMGAYGHSRMREFFVGSNTSKMISSSVVPLLLLR
jgi:nucleotide-binding universal stress UspA family protein